MVRGKGRMRGVVASLLAALLLQTGAYAQAEGEIPTDTAPREELSADFAEHGGYEGTVSSSDMGGFEDNGGEVSAVLTDEDGYEEELVGAGYGNNYYLPYANAKYFLRYQLEDSGEIKINSCSPNEDSTAEVCGDIVIPDEIDGHPVTKIGNSAFNPSYVGQFYGTVTLPKGLKSIEGHAFSRQSNLTGDLIIPDGVTSIGREAFYNCTGFNGKLVLPKELKVIEASAFRYCAGLNGSLIFSDGLTEIGEYAFEGCSGFTGDLRLPEGLVSIASEAFWKCSGFNGTLTLPGSLTSIGWNAFKGCSGFTGDLVLPDGLSSLGNTAFLDCSGFNGKLVLPDSLTSIGNGAFYNCSGLTGNLVLPKGLETIAQDTFVNCSEIVSVSIPASVTSIQKRAFDGCCGLANIYFEGGNWGAVTVDTGNFYLQNARVQCNSYYTAGQMPPSVGGNETPVAVLKPSGSSKPVPTYEYYLVGSSTVNSYLYDNGNGVTRVEYDDEKVIIENYDSNFRYQAGWTLDLELPIWGGFYAGEKYNFMVFGQENPGEDDAVEVIRVVKYDKAWNRLGHASLRGANTTQPFAAGSLRLDEYGGMLYIHTCHLMYTSSDGLRHQSNMTFALREEDTWLTDRRYNVSNISTGYVSHSFNQFLLVDGDGNIVTMDHGDAYPRSAVVIRYGKKAGRNAFTGGNMSSVNLLVFPGEIGDNNTNASLGGLAETRSGYIAAYNYSAAGGGWIRDIHISYLPKDSFSDGSVVTWTNPAAKGTTPVIASAGEQGGYVLWRDSIEGQGVCYVHYDAQGNISQVQTAGSAMLSDCQPILYRGNLVWYASDEKSVTFYTLNEGGISAYDPTQTGQIVPVPQDPAQVRSFVSRMYTVALGRDAEPQGLNDWTNRLLSYEVDGSGIANGFILSDEFKNKKVSDEVYVDTLYRTFFDREADPDGRATWLGTLANGNSREYVLAGFVNSVEFDKLCGRFGIIRGTMEVGEKAIGPGVRQFVRRCYVKVLGREAEPAGESDWIGRIAREEETPESTAKLFFFSEEYMNKKTSDEAFVETLYQTFMDRASDPAGKSDWLGRLAAGASREEVLEGFSRSEEFSKILKSFGL